MVNYFCNEFSQIASVSYPAMVTIESTVPTVIFHSIFHRCRSQAND